MDHTPSSLAVLLTSASACSSGRDIGPAPSFGPAAGDPRAAVLSVTGTAPNDIWLVGAQPAPAARPLALRFDGAEWSTVDTGILHDLWWAHAFPGGPVFLSGGGASVLRMDDGVATRLPTPPFFGNTVFGVWGATPEDMWAVGGFAGRNGGECQRV